MLNTSYRHLEINEAFEEGEPVTTSSIVFNAACRYPTIFEEDVDMFGMRVGPMTVKIQHTKRGFDLYETEAVSIIITAENALEIANSLRELAHEHHVRKIKSLEDRSILQAGAQLCMLGKVGELRIVNHAHSFHVQYMAVKETSNQPDTILLEVVDISHLNLPPGREQLLAFAKKLTGGVSSVLVTLKGFASDSPINKVITPIIKEFS